MAPGRVVRGTRARIGGWALGLGLCLALFWTGGTRAAAVMAFDPSPSHQPSSPDAPTTPAIEPPSTTASPTQQTGDEPVRGTPPLSPSAKVSDARLAELVRLLGHPRWDRRQAAGEELRGMGFAVAERLVRAYRGSDDLEVRLRLERIIYDLYMDEHLLNKNGFLGIRIGGMPLLHSQDPRVPKDGHGIQVGDVLPDTAAERAGLRGQDVIIKLDGQSVRFGDVPGDPRSFSELLRKHGAETTVRLTVLRRMYTFEVAVKLGRRPKELYAEGASPELQRMLPQTEERFFRWWMDQLRVNGPGQAGEGSQADGAQTGARSGSEGPGRP